MAEYDPKVIQEFADRLYTKAKSIVRSYTLLGIITVGIAGLTTQQPIFGLIGAVLGGIIGYMYGKEKAFQYKLQAQTKKVPEGLNFNQPCVYVIK